MRNKYMIMLLVLTFWSFLVYAQETVVNPNAGITVASGATLNISGGDLVLKSDATGDASLIDFGLVTYSGGGQANVQRYLTEGRWHLISSPVSNALSGMFLGDYLQQHSESTNAWTDIAQVNNNLGIMQGYALWSVDGSPTTEIFSGITNTGTKTKSFTQNNEGWNIIGNPYPSALDWDAVAIPPELSGAIWLFDPTIGVNGDYVYYINGGGAANTTTQYIASGQAFFVRATGGAGTLSFENNDRVHNGQSFYKGAESEVLVLKATGNDITTQTAIRFNENATRQADRLYDVYRIISDSPDVPMLFTKAGTQIMAINTLPAIEGNEIVPLWFRAGTDGNYSIKATEMESFDSETPIYLQDLETNTIQNLRQNPEYIFDYKSGSDKSFLVYFTEPAKSNTAGDVKIYSNENMLSVKFPVTNLTDPNFNAQIMVYDLTGKVVFQMRTTNIDNQISLNGHHSIYMIRVISGSETATGKVFIP